MCRKSARGVCESGGGVPGGLARATGADRFGRIEGGGGRRRRRLAARAVKDTAGLDYALLRDAALVHHMTGDAKGAVAYAKRALARCEEVEDDCDNVRGIARDYQRCPFVLVPMPAEAQSVLVGKFTVKTKPGSPADCK